VTEGNGRGSLEWTIAGNDQGNLTRSFQAFASSTFPPRSRVRTAPGCWLTSAAEVIKIESAEGEIMRTRPPVRIISQRVRANSMPAKKSVVLDLKSPDAIR